MKNLYTKLGVGLSMLSASIIPLVASADGFGSGLTSANSSLTNSQSVSSLSAATSLPTMIGKGVGVFLGLLGILFVVLVVYAGFLYLTSNGEETNVKKAKKLLTQAVIGMIITVSAYAISGYVIAALATIIA